jgi:hypothetical protein
MEKKRRTRKKIRMMTSPRIRKKRLPPQRMNLKILMRISLMNFKKSLQNFNLLIMNLWSLRQTLKTRRRTL